MITDERQKQLADLGYSVREHTTVQSGYVVYFQGEPIAGTLVMSRNDGWRLAELMSNQASVWSAVEAFLYPEWYKGSGYRGDLHYTPEVQEIEEFYQNYDSSNPLSADDLHWVAQALAKEQAKDVTTWAGQKQKALGVIRALGWSFKTRDFVAQDRAVYQSNLWRLQSEGLLERHSGDQWSVK